MATNYTGTGKVMRAFEDVSVGTTLRVLITARGAGVELDLEYRSLTLEDPEDPEKPETIGSNTIQTKLLMQPGEPQIGGLLQENKTTIITVRLER